MATRSKPGKAARSKKVPRRRGEAAPAEVSPRVARRERRRERSREEIIEAARRVLVRDGLAATTLDAVAREVGLTKAALYYYFPSKDALLFEVVYGAFAEQAQRLHAAVETSSGGPEALRAIIRETVQMHAPRLDDFRLMYLQIQLLAPDAVHIGPEQLARIRPLNDLAFAGAAKLLAEDWGEAPGRAGVDPRLMAFLANLAALGVLTMKGMVESVDDPLRYSDDEIIEALGRIFEAAAAPR